jgi:hypothetical protein
MTRGGLPCALFERIMAVAGDSCFEPLAGQPPHHHLAEIKIIITTQNAWAH